MEALAKSGNRNSQHGSQRAFQRLPDPAGFSEEDADDLTGVRPILVDVPFERGKFE